MPRLPSDGPYAALPDWLRLALLTADGFAVARAPRLRRGHNGRSTLRLTLRRQHPGEPPVVLRMSVTISETPAP